MAPKEVLCMDQECIGILKIVLLLIFFGLMASHLEKNYVKQVKTLFLILSAIFAYWINCRFDKIESEIKIMKVYLIEFSKEK
jgi:hypothetical protein